MSAALDARGLKRVCVECGIRFYDMNKRPIVCPSCGTEFTGIEKIKGRKPRAATPDPVVKEKEDQTRVLNDDDEDDIVEDDSGVEEISLDDAAAAEKANEKDDDDEDNAKINDDNRKADAAQAVDEELAQETQERQPTRCDKVSVSASIMTGEMPAMETN